MNQQKNLDLSSCNNCVGQWSFYFLKGGSSSDVNQEEPFVVAEIGTVIEKALAVGIKIGVLALIGLIAGIFPAIKAAKVDPVESLRYE